MSPPKRAGEIAIDGTPYESGEERDARLRRQTVEDGDRIMAKLRAGDDRQVATRAARPRREALRGMIRAAFGRGHPDLQSRTRALAEHPVYRALPEARQREWDQFLDHAAEAERQGNFGPLWAALEQTASVQAENLTSWDPPGDDLSPEELAKLVPR